MPSCAATRDEAARVAGLFAQAARGAFPQVRFETPASEPAQLSERPAPAAPAAAASTGRSWRVNAWLPWAVAAAVWLAIPGTVLPVLNILHRADRTQADADRSISQLEPKIAEADKARLAIDEPRNAARRNLAAHSQHLDAVLAKWLNTESEALARATALAGRRTQTGLVTAPAPPTNLTCSSTMVFPADTRN